MIAATETQQPRRLERSIWAVAATWDQRPGFGPKWYPLGVVAIALPFAWIGGWLADRRGHATAVC
jgi:hypothetical protein